jgi:hypothetical protein
MARRRSDERGDAHCDAQGCVEKTSQHWIVLDLAQINFRARSDDSLYALLSWAKP